MDTIFSLDIANRMSYNRFEDVFWIAEEKVYNIVVNWYCKSFGTNSSKDWQIEIAEYLNNNNIKFRKLFCGNEGFPYRWSDLNDRKLTVEDFEKNWRKYYYGLEY